MNDASVNSRLVAENAIDRFRDFEAMERNRLYRLHLQTTVNKVSQLATDLAGHGGLTLCDVAHRLPLPDAWPWRIGEGRIMVTSRRWRPIGSAVRLKGGVSSSGLRSWPRLGPFAANIRPYGDDNGELAFAAVDDVLEAVARLGSCIVQTFRGSGRLLLSETLPETFVVTLPGRPLDELVQHPVLSGRGYVIVDVEKAEYDQAHVVTFTNELRPYTMPWAQLIDQEIERPLGSAGA
ncbi:hypothetical protein [Sphingomonas faeni]|uniref:hypothetical protein n=1 Tax=Sphingomonas faeni TaxID=185950 RepID=UPI0033490CEF